MRLSGWGNFPRAECRLLSFSSAEAAAAIVRAEARLIPRGAGRAYGDATLNIQATLETGRFDRFLSFDSATGILAAEAGARLADILAVFVPRGWFPPVVPGTKHVTLGGMIAADIHGKNHHLDGCFGNHVDSLTLLDAGGTAAVLSRADNAELFAATCGGMGLTGLILDARVRLRPVESAYMMEETIVAHDLDAAMDIFEQSADWPYSVGWVDGHASGQALGRGLVFRGRHARRDELPPAARDNPLTIPARKPPAVPDFTPAVARWPWAIRLFNAAYRRWATAKAGTRLTDYEAFFFPLDAADGWNRLYGDAGFVQHQSVLPKAASRSGLRQLLMAAAKAGRASPLAVLKLFGPQDGLLTFPMEGYTLTLDFPWDGRTMHLLEELDAIVADHGGRLYLAKDARARPAMMERGYPRLARFREIRRASGAAAKFASLQSERLGL